LSSGAGACYDAGAMASPKPDDAIRQYLRALGAKGGKIGGKLRWQGVSAEERSRQMRAIRAGPTARGKKKERAR